MKKKEKGKREEKMFIGVDPGLRGAIAFIHDDGYLLDVFDMPLLDKTGIVDKEVNPVGVKEILMYCHKPEESFFYIEQVGAKPQKNGKAQGTASAFSFGHSVGVVEGVAGSMGFRIRRATPTKWKGVLDLIGVKGKRESVIRARHKFPGNEDKFTYGMDGRAEAALIGYFGYRVENRL